MLRTAERRTIAFQTGARPESSRALRGRALLRTAPIRTLHRAAQWARRVWSARRSPLIRLRIRYALWRWGKTKRDWFWVWAADDLAQPRRTPT